MTTNNVWGAGEALGINEFTQRDRYKQEENKENRKNITLAFTTFFLYG